jgi:signal transduction histidine kinase
MTHPIRVEQPKRRRRRARAAEDAGWAAFERDVVKPLFETIDPTAPVRAWVTGDSTPTNAFVVALALRSGSVRRRHRGSVRIIASCADEDATLAARGARLASEILDSLPRAWREVARDELGEEGDLAAWARRQILFTPHRVVDDPPFVQLDVIVASHLGVEDPASPIPGHLAFGLREGGALWFEEPTLIDSLDFEPSGASGRLYRRVRRQMGRVQIDALVTEIVAAERLRMAEDLHDGIGQHLTAISLALHRLRAIAREEGNLEPMLERLEETVAAAREDLRAVARGGLPPIATSSNLVAAIEEAVEDARRILMIPIAVDVRFDPGPLDEGAVHQLVRIAQEAIRNAATAHATHIAVSVKRDQHGIRLAIEDDGQGLANEHPYRKAGLGIRIMRHRAHTIGATLQFVSGPRGTEIVCTF